MVYGLNIKPEWGYYPKVELLDGDINQVNAINPVDDGGVAWSSRRGGVPVDGTHFPKRVKWDDAKGNPVPDFDKMPTLNVSERAKKLIENVEPGVHQFFPVEYFDRNGDSLETRYWFVVCNRIDSLDREHSIMVLYRGEVWRPPSDLVRRGEPIPDHIDLKQPAKIVFNLKAIGNAQLWHDKHLDGGGVYISDELAQRLKDEALTGLKLHDNGMESV